MEIINCDVVIERRLLRWFEDLESLREDKVGFRARDEACEFVPHSLGIPNIEILVERSGLARELKPCERRGVMLLLRLLTNGNLQLRRKDMGHPALACEVSVVRRFDILGFGAGLS